MEMGSTNAVSGTGATEAAYTGEEAADGGPNAKGLDEERKKTRSH